MKEKIAVISFSNINNDSRVKRQIESLKKEYEIICFGFGENIYNDIQFYKIRNNHFNFQNIFSIIFILNNNFKKYTFSRFSYQFIINKLNENKIKAFILNDCFSWPLIDYVDCKKCIIDAHEFSPEEFSKGIIWNLFKKKYKKWCSSYVKKAKFHFSVENNICKKWELFSGRKFVELRNFSNYYKIENIKNQNEINYPIRIVHHGICNSSRRIENMIKAIIYSGELYEGYFYLYTKSKILDMKLKIISHNSNVKILEPIKEQDLIPNTQKYDLGILSIYPSNINYKYCLPNKLFQFIQSRLPIIAGPTPSIIDIIEKYKIGIISKSFSPSDLSKAILSISKDDIKVMKKNCEIAAQKLCWENESVKLFDKIKNINN